MLNVNFTPFPVLTTDRLILRAVGPGDANELFLMRSNETLMRYIGKPRPRSVDEILPFIQKIENMVANDEGIAWAVTLKSDPKIIGQISFHKLMKEHYRAEVGYMLRQDFHGKGIMDEALQAVLEYGFNVMKLHSAEGIVHPDNKSSSKLLKRHGFVLEGHIKENYFYDGKFFDSTIYSLLTPHK